MFQLLVTVTVNHVILGVQLAF